MASRNRVWIFWSASHFLFRNFDSSALTSAIKLSNFMLHRWEGKWKKWRIFKISIPRLSILVNSVIECVKQGCPCGPRAHFQWPAALLFELYDASVSERRRLLLVMFPLCCEALRANMPGVGEPVQWKSHLQKTRVICRKPKSHLQKPSEPQIQFF